MTEYRIATDQFGQSVYRRLETEDGVYYHIWSPPRNDWVSSDAALRSFIGFEPSLKVSEKEALKIIETMKYEKIDVSEHFSRFC